jgi:hypothetical protein
MAELEPETVLVRLQALVSQVDDDLVFFDSQAGKYFATGIVGADIWQLIEEPRSIRDVCIALTEKYDVSEERCLEEVQSFARDLLAVGLIRRC